MTSPLNLPAGAADCHAHVLRTDLPLIAGRHSAPLRHAEVDEYLRVLDAHGIRYGVLTAPSFYGNDNRLLLRSLQAAGGRLRGTAIVEPEIGDADLDVLYAHGVRGVRLNWLRREPLPDSGSRAYRALYPRLRERGMHVEVYVEGEHLAAVLPPILASGVRLVLDHFGGLTPGFPTLDLLREALAQGQTWIKLSAPYRLAGQDAAALTALLLREAGAQRLLWGTDWPWVSNESEVDYARCLGWLGEWLPDPGPRDIILRDTPRLLFDFED